MLEILTFTGVDEHTDFGRIIEICHTYPRVEFAILVGSLTRKDPYSKGNGIFPGLAVVDLLKFLGLQRGRLPQARVAVHLCGFWARSSLRPGEPSGEVIELCRGFDRVQINLHADVGYPAGIPTPPSVAAARLVGSLPGCESIIFQHRDSTWDGLPTDHPGVEYLFDRSEGTGREAFDEWPEPRSAPRRVGYAGGIGPHNIGQAMEFVDRYPESRLWLDMESKVRTDGRFDLDKVENVCQLVWPKKGGRSAPGVADHPPAALITGAPTTPASGSGSPRERPR